MTRRSSARLTPRTSVGKCGSIRAHCSSLSQNRFLLINPSPNTNQYRIVEPEGLMSSDPSNCVHTPKHVRVGASLGWVGTDQSWLLQWVRTCRLPWVRQMWSYVEEHW